MKLNNVLALAVAVLAGSSSARAEPPAPEVYVGVSGGATFPLRSWDLGGKEVQEGALEPGIAPQGGLRVGFQLLPRLAFEVGAQWLSSSVSGGSNSILSYSGNVLYAFKDGDWSPFVVAGGGAYQSLDGGALGADADYQANIGLGVRGMALDWLAWRVDVRDHITDGFGTANVIGGNNLELTLGLDVFVAKAFGPGDKDKDGIVDLQDKCLLVAGVASAQGCPDGDGDTVADADDRCPLISGKPEFAGCTDTDGDTVADLDDQCPAVAGKTELQGCPDGDADGLADKDDSCPAEAGDKALNGCPDGDTDGIADKDDRCPARAGIEAFKGCPDSDADGITDAEDICPQAAGEKSLGGCPDGDKDGFADKDDACIAIAGVASAKGCPDQDGDTVADADDLCIAEAGKPALKGCPDKDSDAVADKDDKCPDVRGLVENQGCLPAEVQKFTGAIKGITFDNGKATVAKSSFKTLDLAVKVFQKFTAVRVKVEGHTDDVGDAAVNKELSAERAKAVKEYLVSKGVDAGRLESEGYGSERPVGDNKKPKGREQNRRVEFSLIEQ